MLPKTKHELDCYIVLQRIIETESRIIGIKDMEPEKYKDVREKLDELKNDYLFHVNYHPKQ